MTFKLVLLIFAVVNGVPSDEPIKVFPYTADFATAEACMAFAKSPDGIVLRDAMREFVQSQNGTITAKLGCAKDEDNTI